MSLKKIAFSGLIYSALDLFFTKGLTFITSLYLARVLGPSQFGLISLITIFISIGTILVDSGFSSSLVRSKNVDKIDFSTVFFTNLAISVIIYIIFYLAAPYISLFYKQDVLTKIIRVFCLTFIINAFSTIQNTLLIKELKFKSIMFYNMPSNLLGAVVGITLVHLNYGVWSVVFMYLTAQLSFCLIVWNGSLWKPSLVFSKVKLKYHFNFGSKLMIASLLNTIFENIYNVILGRFYSTKAAGYYERAKTLNEYPVILLSTILSKVAYPMLSKIEDDRDRIALIYKKLIQITFFITAPLMLGLAAIAKPIIVAILGPVWSPAIPFFQILCLSSILYPIHVFNINVLQVFGRSDLFLRLELYKKVLVLVIIVISIQFGIYVMLIGSVVSSFLALIINGFYSQKMISYPLVKQLVDFIPTLLISLVAVLTIFSLQLILKDFNIYITAFIAFFSGMCVYLGIHYFLKTTAIQYLFNILKQ